MKSDRLTILVYSCKKNSDMWPIFLTLFKKYWPDCLYRIILLTDVDRPKVSKGFDYVVEYDGSWYEMIMAGIECAKTPYVSLWMDDYLLCDKVYNEDIERFIDCAEKYNCANIRLIEADIIKTTVFELDKNFTCYHPGSAYSFSTQVGIWSAQFLKRVMKPEWTPWDFERKGSLEVSRFSERLLGAGKYVFPYVEGVRRGKWMREGVGLCRRNGIELDFCKRPKMSDFEMAWIYFKSGILGINPNFVQRVQNMLKK